MGGRIREGVYMDSRKSQNGAFLEQAAVAQVNLNDDVVHRTQDKLDLGRVLDWQCKVSMHDSRDTASASETGRTVAQVKWT